MVLSEPWGTWTEKLDESEREVNEKIEPPHEDLYETNVGMKIFIPTLQVCKCYKLEFSFILYVSEIKS